MKIVMLDRTGADFSLEKKIFRLENASFIVTYFKDAEDLKAITHDADILMFNDAEITGDMIAELKKCKMIIRYGRDMDSVDLEAAGKRGIFVCNTPNYDTYDIAEHTMALLLSAAKRIPFANQCTRAGQWNPERVGKVRRLTGTTLGIIGCDASAKLVARRAEAFDMKIMIADPLEEETSDEQDTYMHVDMQTLIQNADYISLHLPYSKETHHILGMNEFVRMKKNAIIINACHGSLINESELVFALLSSEIEGAALDVFEKEPLPLTHKLLSMDRIVLTPHIAASSEECEAILHEEVTKNVCRFLHGDTPFHVVNQKYLKKVML